MDTRLEEEGVRLSRGEEVDEVCSPKSGGDGRYGLLRVSISANEKMVMSAILGPIKQAFVVGGANVTG